MPLRCVELDGGRALHAFDLSAEAWVALGAENQRRRHLRMPCCSAEVTLRQSKLGTRYFAHKSAGACSTAPETETHLRLKQMTVEVARTHGWEAQTEVAGQTPQGEPWRAVVLVKRGGAQVAIEIQWSTQTNGETMRRQERYAASGVGGLWLFRQASFPVDERLPAARILGTPETGFAAALPDVVGQARHTMALQAFLAGAFGRRLKLGLSLGVQTRFIVWGARLTCGRCQARTQVLKAVEAAAGPHQVSLSMPDLGRHPGLWDRVRLHLPSSFPSGTIRPRHSQTRGRLLLSNGCSHCGALIGEVLEDQLCGDEHIVCTYSAALDEPWRDAIRHHPGVLGAEGCTERKTYGQNPSATEQLDRELGSSQAAWSAGASLFRPACLKPESHGTSPLAWQATCGFAGQCGAEPRPEAGGH